MTELNSFLIGLNQKECQSADECMQHLMAETYTHTYYTDEYRIPISEINQNVCMCLEPKNHMMKAFQCKGDCKNNRPFLILDIHKPERADMIDKFTCNVEFIPYIGGIINTTERVLTLCSVFHGAYALIYLDKPNLPSEIIFSKRLHYFSTEIRRNIIKMMNPNGILDGDLIYKYGMAGIA